MRRIEKERLQYVLIFILALGLGFAIAKYLTLAWYLEWAILFVFAFIPLFFGYLLGEMVDTQVVNRKDKKRKELNEINQRVHENEIRDELSKQGFEYWAKRDKLKQILLDEQKQKYIVDVKSNIESKKETIKKEQKELAEFKAILKEYQNIEPKTENTKETE